LRLLHLLQSPRKLLKLCRRWAAEEAEGFADVVILLQQTLS
jgi:hypothetical protein